jgi:hypothetical protein
MQDVAHPARMRTEWLCPCGRWMSDNYFWHDHVAFDAASPKLISDPMYSRHVKTPADPQRLVPYDQGKP